MLLEEIHISCVVCSIFFGNKILCFGLPLVKRLILVKIFFGSFSCLKKTLLYIFSGKAFVCIFSILLTGFRFLFF